MSSFIQYAPVKLVVGENSIDRIGGIASSYGTKVVLLTPTVFPAFEPWIHKIETLLAQSNLEVLTISNTIPNPPVKLVEETIAQATKFDADLVVALGGGSTIDTAKVVAYCTGIQDVDLQHLFLEEGSVSTLAKNDSRSLPLIAISTTAGTGSQVTQAAVITDEMGVKRTLFKQEFFPQVAIIDPAITLSLPQSLTSSTGFDAFCHLSESYIAGNLSEFMKPLAIQGMRLIGENLPKLMDENNIQARLEMMMADTMGGMCLSNGGAHVPHMIGEMVTSAIPTINHGVSLACVFPYFIREFYDTELKDSIADVIECICQKRPSNKSEAIDEFEQFMKKIHLHVEIQDFKPEKDQIHRLIELVHQDGRFDQEKVGRILNAFEKPIN